MAVERIFRSTEKRSKFRSTDYESFDQLIKHNFDQLIFGQTTPCHCKDFNCWVISKQWPLAGEFVEFEYSPKIRQFGEFEYSPKWPFPPFWPDSIHSPAIRQLLSPDSIHLTDIRQPLSLDSIHSRKANLHEFSEFGEFSECRLDRFIHIKYVICA